MMNPYKCQLCGETYLGEIESDRCPFCGAAGYNLVPPAEWVNYEDMEISDISHRNLEQAFELEMDNASFYAACAKAAETRISESIFKRLSKHEIEHAELIADVIGERDLSLRPAECPEADVDKFADAHRREMRAIKFYLGVADSAPEPRISDMMRSLAEVESEHLKISNLYR